MTARKKAINEQTLEFPDPKVALITFKKILSNSNLAMNIISTSSKVIGSFVLLLFLTGPQCFAFSCIQDAEHQVEESPEIFIHYVLYYDGEFDAKALFVKLSQGKFELLESPEGGVDSPGVILRPETVEQGRLPPRIFCRGDYNAEVAEKFSESKFAFSVIGVGPFDPEHRLLKNVTTTVGEMANEMDAFVFDVADSLTFTNIAFNEIRADEIRQGNLSSNQFGIRAYRVDEGIRSVTMGLEKFGQTNIAIANFSEHHMNVIDSFKGMLVQAVIESDAKVAPGTLTLTPEEFSNTAKKKAIKGLLRAGFSTTQVELADIESLKGDPRELLGVVFENEPGEELWAEQDAFLLKIFKRTRHSSQMDPDAIEGAIEAARTRAVEILRDEEQWAAPRRLKIAVGVSNNEVVWLEVTRFEDDAGAGILLSQPNKNPDLKSGDEIEFEPDMVMDFVLTDPETTIEKGGVDELIQRMNR